MAVRFYDRIDDARIRFSVIIARETGKWLFCKPKKRETLEFPGGHREPGETPGETARRELWEETGATGFTLRPVCAYGVQTPDGEESCGMLYVADVSARDPELHSEIEKVFLMDTLPDNWTYPGIQPFLLEEVGKRGFIG